MFRALWLAIKPISHLVGMSAKAGLAPARCWDRLRFKRLRYSSASRVGLDHRPADTVSGENRGSRRHDEYD
jgi:hypothetical protein